MPELPEVETLRRELARVLVGQKIASGEILWRGAIKPLSPKQFLQKIIGQKIKKVERRAKILLLSLHPSDLTLAIHLKMTGQLIYQPHPLQLPRRGRERQSKRPLPFGEGRGGVHTRVIFNFTDRSHLYFNDLRKFGWLKILSADHRKILIARHGLEPLTPEFSLKKFQTILSRYPNRILKALLLDQTLIAGLGNIYVDESCFASRIKPARKIKTLSKLEIKKLYSAIKRILKLAITKGGTSARDYVRSDGSLGNFVPHLKVYGRAKQPCKICRAPITKIKLAGRGTHFCPRCQK
ncbi:MAG: bifunctional DNA-formamidopyrimidine glycosylase/DNA-(apurinic or apyrimidinic site) lyase [Candidatus Vogelbacteria bacterium]